MRKSIWVALAATLALSSCFKTAETWTITGDNPVVFSEKVERYAGTRAMDGHPVENVPNQPSKGLIPIGKSFGVWAWSHEDETATAFDELQNEQVTRAANNGGEAVYTYSPTAKWPNQQLSFLAYYPYSASSDAAANGGMSTPPTVANDGTTMTIPYTVPTAGEKHIDLMYARKGATEGYDPVELEFRHALSRMKFSALIDGFSGSDKVRVTGIKLIGATLAGTLTVPADTDEAATWALGSTKGDITVADGRGERPDHILDSDLSGTMQSLITATGASTTAGDLIVLPQDVKGMSLEITATLNGNEYEPYIIPLAAAPRMLMNFIYNYRIVLTPKDASLYVEVIPWGEGMNEDSEFDGQYFLRVNRSRFEFGSAPGAAELTVATDHPDDWTITDVQGNTDNWLTIDPQAGEGNGDETPVTLTVAENTTGGQREATFNVKAGNLKKTIHVVQKPEPEPVLTATDPESAYAYTGGTQNISVTSHDGTTAQNPVAWEVTEYSTDGGTTWTPGTPDYLTFGTPSGTGATKTWPVTLATAPISSQSDAANFDKSPRGTEEVRWNLASPTGGTTQETANCYIVNRPGWYSVPLAYGNAVQGGAAVNTPYISTQAAATRVLKNFLRHDGNPITASYIYDNTFASPISDAAMVWQDVAGLVTDVKLDGDEENLLFYIDPATIAQGNAVVAVRDANGAIMWSWHIWVTNLVNADSPAADPIMTYNGLSFDHMQYPLGYVESATTIYGTRNLSVRITQTGVQNPATTTITMAQNGGTASTGHSTHTFYQFGRKDPMVPYDISIAPDLNYPITGNHRFVEWGAGYWVIGGDVEHMDYGQPNSGSIQGNIPAAIRNPHVIYTAADEDWNFGITGGAGETAKTSLNNLWNIENTLTLGGPRYETVVKTVYDPSPAGFKVPHSGAYTFFSLDGDNHSSLGNLNITGEFNNGYYFNTGYGESTVFFLAIGLRHSNGGRPTQFAGTNNHLGYYWTALPYNATQGYSFIFGRSGSIHPCYRSFRGFAYAVRPIADE